MRRPSVPLRVYLLLLVLGAMLPGAVLTAMLVAQTFAGNRAVVERRLLDSARVDAAALDRELEATVRTLEVLATSPALLAGDVAAFHEEAERVRRTQRGWFSVVLLTPAATQLMNTRLPLGTPLPAAHEPDSVRELVRTRQPVIGVMGTVPPGGPGWGFAVRVPVVKDGRLEYVLSATIDASSLSRLVDTTLPANEEWTRTILDSSATVAARSRDADRWVGQPATPSFRDRVLSQTSEVFPEQSMDGTLVYAALARGAFGWTSAVIVPRNVLDAPVRGSTAALLMGGAMVMFGTLAALLLVSRRVSRDLHNVAAAAESVARGQTAAVGPTHIAETERLLESLRAAALLLERRQRERDAEVERAQAAQGEAERANQTKDQFLAVLGHELRNPLAPALTALELMRMHNPEACARERQVLERQVGHMARLVNDLLDVASLARGKVALRLDRCEVGQVVDRAVDMARPLIDRHRHQLRVDVPRSDLPLEGDEDRLVQVLTNLLTNAAKYTPAGGRIWLTARREDQEAVIACEDNGPGLTADLAETLFDPFAQGPRTIDRAQGGLGLGLALARSLTMLHGGALHFETPASGVGSRFVVRLPLAMGERPNAARAAPASRPAAEAGRRVLVVDDNVDACEMLRAALEAAGHEVATALDGPEAERVARRFAPAVAIVDIGLPGMDGYELAARLRQLDGEMRLIALTGYGQPSDVDAAARAGFDQHFTKPVEVTVLLDELESVSVGRT